MEPYTANDFYNDEKKRLQKKHQNVKSIMNSQNRLAVLNDSYRKRYSKYTEILIVLVLAFSVNLGMVILQKQVPSIPQIVFDVVFIVILFLVFVYLFSAIAELYNRSLMNYDEIDSPAYEDPITKTSTSDANNASYNSGDVLKLKVETCVGSKCCPDGYRYDNDVNKCVIDAVPTTAPVSNSNTNTNTPPANSGSTNSGSTNQVSRVISNVNGPFFTTLEQTLIENAYTHTSFNDPGLKRSQNSENVNPLKESTSLNYSTF
jgi:hypothetical protein